MTPTNGRQFVLYKLSILTNPVCDCLFNAVTLLLRLKRGPSDSFVSLGKHKSLFSWLSTGNTIPIPGSITDLVHRSARSTEACHTRASGKGDRRFAGLPHALIVQIFWKLFFVSIRKVGRERQALTKILVCRQRRVLDLH